MKPDEEKETAFEPTSGTVSDANSGDLHEAEAAEPDGRDDDQVADGPAETQTERLQASLEAAEAAAAESQDLYLRERAELENFKKRSMRERSEALRYAAEPLARDLLGVIDNLERALDHARASEDPSSVVEGVDLVLKGALEMLGRHGIERIDATGAAFDPAIHEAVAQVPDDSVEANRVVEQYLPGYRMHERLLRAAQVTVSTGSGQN